MGELNANRLGSDIDSFQALLLATLESTSEGILATDAAGNPTLRNRRFNELWQTTGPMSATEAAECISNQLKDPAGYLRRLEEIAATNPEKTQDLLELQDGR